MPVIAFIPEVYKNGFTELSLLKEETFLALQEALLSVELSASTEDLAAKVANLKSLNESQIEKIFLSVGGLISFLDEEADLSEIVNDIIRLGLKDTDSKITEPQDSEKLKERLLLLLKNKKIFYASKAADLVTETENQFLTCRIVTDVRPIFDIDLDVQPTVGIIMHNLHIHYQGNETSQHEDIYFSMNSNDLQLLLNALERAERKEDSLRLMLSKWGVTNLNT